MKEQRRAQNDLLYRRSRTDEQTTIVKLNPQVAADILTLAVPVTAATRANINR